MKNMKDLQEENQELRLKVLKLKQTIQVLHTNVQQLSLTLLKDFRVQMYAGISRKCLKVLFIGCKQCQERKEEV